MAEYIEREAVIKICSNQYKECLRKNDWCGDTVAWNIDLAVKAIPAADVVEVKRGRWTAVKPTGVGATARCSICGDAIYGYHTMNFCPNCGCLMGGD